MKMDFGVEAALSVVTTAVRSGFRILRGKTSTMVLPLRSQPPPPPPPPPPHRVLCLRGSNTAEGCS